MTPTEILNSSSAAHGVPLRFIDLFAGIGGFHLALGRLGMQCVFASEIDPDARQTYLANHAIDARVFNSDIRAVDASDIPDHDILCAGFPCQPFSQAGYKKGFHDGENSERGNLFFTIVDILQAKRPKAFILENVRHLLNHDDGNTFKVIQQHLEESGYSVHYKIMKASEFGRPQHRPRIYIVGFDQSQVNTLWQFEFPKPIPLKLTMSDVWNAPCDRDIGFTLRVGGRGSPIDDRRNWDAYRVAGEVRQLQPEQGKKMMGYPDDFILPTSITKAMKQLGNSVCVDVVEHVARAVVGYLGRNQMHHEQDTRDDMQTLNKGEWSELYVFFKILLDQDLYFLDRLGQRSSDHITVLEIAHRNADLKYVLEHANVKLMRATGELIEEHPLSSVLNQDMLSHLLASLKGASGRSFSLEQIRSLLHTFKIAKFKGSSLSKGDIDLSFQHQGCSYADEAFGIKSHLGNPPTLLNASSATNFIYEVSGFSGSVDEVNVIDTKSKIKDRMKRLIAGGAQFSFVRLEQPTHEANLRKVDSKMPEILSDLLLRYYQGQGSVLLDLEPDDQKRCRLKDYLKAVMLGMFPAKPWDGNHTSNGTVLCDQEGQLSILHVLKDDVLKDYLLHNTRLDTPSSSRHRFGSVYKEQGSLFMKLNLQVRLRAGSVSSVVA